MSLREVVCSSAHRLILHHTYMYERRAAMAWSSCCCDGEDGMAERRTTTAMTTRTVAAFAERRTTTAMTTRTVAAFAAAAAFLLTAATAVEVDPVAQAIAKARQRLQEKPPGHPYAFPKTQFRLALLLESRLPPLPSASLDQWREVASLYAASAYNETHGNTASVRVDSLTKAASIMVDVGDSDAAETMLTSALDITNEDIDELVEEAQSLRTAYAAAFEKLIVLLLDRASQKGDGPTSTSEQSLLERALQLCDKCAELSPDEPVVDEYRGVVLRKFYRTQGVGGTFVKSTILGSVSGDAPETKPTQSAAAKDVHSAYESAAKKSHEAAVVAALNDEAVGLARYPCGTLRFKYGKKLPGTNQLKQQVDQEELGHLVSLWTRLVRHIILAAAAARESGLKDDEDRHIQHGLNILSHLTISDYVRADLQADLLINAGIRHKARGEKKEAARYFRAALEVQPDDGHALVQLASLRDEYAASVTELSDDYVAGLFDGYSDRFEKELVKNLGYRGHTIVAEAIDRHWNKSRAEGDVVVLDLGVGTGLLGQLLRERIGLGDDAACISSENIGEGKVIIRGVDLSSRMVEISQTRTVNKVSVYDTVEVGDATGFLQSMGSSSIDIITASDVFIYVGALDEVFREASRVLKEGGLVGFTIETPPNEKKGSADGLMLLQSGRFGHSKSYVKDVADKAGLTLVEWKEEILRKQGNEDVEGAAVLLQL